MKNRALLRLQKALPALLVALVSLAALSARAGTDADARLDQLLARPGTQRSLLVDSTLDWGCPCPTWALPYHRELSRSRHVMLLPAASLQLDPTTLALPGLRVRLWGHFTGEELDGVEWARRRGTAPPGYPGAADSLALTEYWRQPGPVFVVNRWCFDSRLPAAQRSRLQASGATACR